MINDDLPDRAPPTLATARGYWPDASATSEAWADRADDALNFAALMIEQEHRLPASIRLCTGVVCTDLASMIRRAMQDIWAGATAPGRAAVRRMEQLEARLREFQADTHQGRA